MGNFLDPFNCISCAFFLLGWQKVLQNHGSKKKTRVSTNRRPLLTDKTNAPSKWMNTRWQSSSRELLRTAWRICLDSDHATLREKILFYPHISSFCSIEFSADFLLWGEKIFSTNKEIKKIRLKSRRPLRQLKLRLFTTNNKSIRLLTNSMAYGTRRFNAAFTRTLQ